MRSMRHVRLRPTLIPVSLALSATLSLAATYPASLEDLLRAYPSRDANRSALDLERSSAEIGVDLAPRKLEDRARPSEEAVALFRTIRKPLGDFLNDELGRPDGGVDPAPAALAKFLAKSQETLEAIRQRLAHGDRPLWERHLEKLNANVLPNLLGHIDLQKTLLADALDKTARGDEEGALADLDASWTLNTALRDEPVLVVQMVAVSIARMQAGALRHVRTPPSLWLDRLHEHDYRDSMSAALRVQGWMWTQPENPPAYERERSTIGKVVGAVFTEPYIRACMRDAAEIWRGQLARLEERRSLCDVDPAAMKTEMRDAVPRWNRLGVVSLNLIPVVITRVARLQLDVELTARILELNASRSRIGAWPPLPKDPVNSKACPGSHWVYESAPGGERSIRLEPDRRWKNEYGLVLPTRFVTAWGARNH